MKGDRELLDQRIAAFPHQAVSRLEEWIDAVEYPDRAGVIGKRVNLVWLLLRKIIHVHRVGSGLELFAVAEPVLIRICSVRVGAQRHFLVIREAVPIGVRILAATALVGVFRLRNQVGHIRGHQCQDGVVGVERGRAADDGDGHHNRIRRTILGRPAIAAAAVAATIATAVAATIATTIATTIAAILRLRRKGAQAYVNHGVVGRLEFIGTGQGELHFRQVFVVVLRDDRPGLHLCTNAVAFARQHLEDHVLRNLFDGIVDGLHLDVDGAGSPRHAHTVGNADVVGLVVGRAADGKVDLNFLAGVDSAQGHPGRAAALGRLRGPIQRQLHDRHRVLDQDRGAVLGMTVVKRAVGDVHHHVLVPLGLLVLLGGDTDDRGNVAGANHHGTAERLIIQFLARGTGDQVIHRQFLGMIPRAGNQQPCPVVAGIVLLLHRDSIHGGDADDREFIVDDENLRLNRCRHQERLAGCHGEDEVFDPLDVLVLVRPDHDQPPGLAGLEGEPVRNLNIIQVVFRAAGNDVRNLQRLRKVPRTSHLDHGHIPAILAGDPVKHGDGDQRRGGRIVVLDVEHQFPGPPGHPVVGGLVIIRLQVHRAGIPARRRDLPHTRNDPRVDPEHNLLGALIEVILLNRHLDLHLVESRREIKLAVGDVRLGIPVQRVVGLEFRAAADDEAHLQRFHQAPGAGHGQERRQGGPLGDRADGREDVDLRNLRREKQQLCSIHVTHLEWTFKADRGRIVSEQVGVERVRFVTLHTHEHEVALRIGEGAQNRPYQFVLRIACDSLLGGDLDILHRDADVRDDLAGDPECPGAVHGHDHIPAGMAALHVGDLATHEVFPLEFKRVGDLGLVVGVFAIAKIPVNAQRVPVGIERVGRERDVDILIHRRGRGGQLQHRRLIAVERADIHHDIDPRHLLAVLALRHRRDVQADALLHERAPDHERRIQHTARAAGRRVEQHGQRPRTLHQQLEPVAAPVVETRFDGLLLPRQVDERVAAG